MHWHYFIKDQQEAPYYKALVSFMNLQKQKQKTIYPSDKNRFRAFELCPFDRINVVILGQDPYHGADQADGLSFSVPDNMKIPPSLRNIYKELESSIENYVIPTSGDLTHWAKQGVLLLNAVLSVEEKKAGSHAKQGWETFTDNAISEISQQKEGVIFLLWGAYAQKKIKLIDTNKHTILTAVHPSPLSAYRGFLGCGHFKKVNELLIANKKKAIKW